MHLIDTHTHINFDVFSSDLEATRARWQEAGVIRLVHSCVEPEEFPQIQTIANRFPEVSFAVGLHPLDADKWTEETGEKITQLATSDSRVVAIGEMGLDFYKAQNISQQEKVFESQLKVAHKLNLPVIIHGRDAAKPMAEILRNFILDNKKLKGVMHCWSGTPEETQWFIDLGFYISFSGIITFKNAKSVQQSAKIVPSDRLLIETDCPFLAPVPKRGKRNEPAYVKYVAEKLAELRNVTAETIAAKTTENAINLFQLAINN